MTPQSKTTRRKKRSQEELKAASSALFYEYQMLEQLVELPPPPPGTVHNALVESILLHVRILMDFVGFGVSEPGTRLGRTDDILAEDFAQGWKPAAVTMLTSEMRGKINKALTHLSYRRLAGPSPDWELGKMAIEVLSEVRRLIAQAHAEDLCEHWSEHICPPLRGRRIVVDETGGYTANPRGEK